MVEWLTGGLMVEWLTGGLMVEWLTGGLMVEWLTGGLMMEWLTGGLMVEWLTGGLIRKRVLSMMSSRGTAHKKLNYIDRFGHANWVNSSNFNDTTLRFVLRNSTIHFLMYLYLVTCFVRVTVSYQCRSQARTISSPSLIR